MPGEGPDRIDDAAIFLSELEEIRRRRALLGLDSSRLAETTRPLDRELIGLAFSGGGIRSACFSLGVSQALARLGRLSGFDYLSTVSGGGYFGSALSSLLGCGGPTPAIGPTGAEGDAFPFRLGAGGAEPEALSHLRSFPNFLTPGGGWGALRLAAVLIRGVILNVFLFLPWVFAAVVLTEINYEVESRLRITHLTGTITAAVVALSLALMLMFPFVVRLARGRFTWDRRNRYELLLAAALAISVAAVALLPFDLLIRSVVRSSWVAVREDVLLRLSALDSIPVWAGIGTAVLLWSILHTRLRWIAVLTDKIGHAVLFALGPVLLGGAYLLLCARFVHLPFVIVNAKRHDVAAIEDSLHAGHLPERFRAMVNVRLREEGGRLSKQPPVITVPPDSQVWIRDSLSHPHGIMGRIFGPTNGPGGGQGIASFPIAVDTNSPGDAQFTVTLRSYPEPRDFLLLVLFLAVVLVNGRIVDVNVTSLHGFYRDRLSKAFLVRRDGVGIAPNDRQRLSELNASGVAPYHLINATVNVSGSSNPLVRGRCADFFLFSKNFSGSRCTGYCPTTVLETADPRFDLASATAISGAAAGPRMGVMTVGSMAGDMTLLDLRLGYWLPNPSHVVRSTLGYGFRGPGPSYLLRESFGILHERGRYVNVSDGGHIENLGVYELLRRRCRLIVAVDAESDPALTCDAVATLIRYARIDLGIVIEIDLSPLREAANGMSPAHWAVGQIHYGDGGEDIGRFVYLKTSLTGDENEYINAFRREHPMYPQESTADQFFDEVRFEVYRALGDHVASAALADAGVAGDLLRSIGSSRPGLRSAS